MKPETINRIYKIVEDNFPAKNGKLDKETYIERQIFFNGIRAALSTPELLEGEGWRKVVWTLDKPRKDAERVFMAATLVDDQWEMEVFEMRKYSDQHGDEYVLLTSEGEAVPYEELSASMYFEIPLLSPPPSE